MVLQVQHGLSAGRNDRTGLFVAERDFLLHLFAHNVSVCDLGAAALLCKVRVRVTSPNPNPDLVVGRVRQVVGGREEARVGPARLG